MGFEEHLRGPGTGKAHGIQGSVVLIWSLCHSTFRSGALDEDGSRTVPCAVDIGQAVRSGSFCVADSATIGARDAQGALLPDG